MSISTIIQYFLADEEMFGNEGSLYVPDELDKFLAQLDRQIEYEEEDAEDDLVYMKYTQSQPTSDYMG